MSSSMEDTLLKISSIGCLATGVQSLAAPDSVNRRWLQPGQTAISDVTRSCGLMTTSLGATGLSVLKSDRETKRKMLLIHGATWLVGAGASAHSAMQGRASKEAAYVGAALTGALGGTMLFHGLKSREVPASLRTY